MPTAQRLTDEERRQKARERNQRYRRKHAALLSARTKAKRQANLEVIQEKERARYAKNRERIRLTKPARAKRYAQKHPLRVRAAFQRYYDANQELMCARVKLYREKHPTEVKTYRKSYRSLNQDKYQSYGQKRRAQKRKASRNDLTAAQWTEIKAAYEHTCVYCERTMQRLTMDHITPLASGGEHTASNIVPACFSCNSRKRDGAPLKPVQPILLTVAPAKKSR